MGLTSIISDLAYRAAKVAVVLLALGQLSLAQAGGEPPIAPTHSSGDSDRPTEMATSAQTGGSSQPSSGRFKSRSRNAPRRVSRTAIALGKHVSGVYGGFGQGAGQAFGVELTTADSIPAIEFRTTALVSLRRYRMFEAEAYVPKIGDEKTHADVWFSYARRTRDNFFGIGPRAGEVGETNYELEKRSFFASLFRDFTSKFQSGVYVGVENANAYRGKDDADPPVDVLFSGDPSVRTPTRYAPGLHSGSKILTYGAFAEYDRRNNDEGLTKGVYFYGRLGSNDALEKGAFSDYGWLEAEVDARGYVPLGSDKTSLALRLFSEMKEPKGSSQIPFYYLSRLGGRSYLRGFDTFRFHGENSLLVSTELRQTVYAREDDGGLDVFVFGDAGQVWGDSRSRTDPEVLRNRRFDSSNWRASVGGGAQYRFSRSTALRVELGHSNERNKVYFSLSRGF